MTRLNSYETLIGAPFWTNEFTTNGEPFDINRYYPNNNPLVIKVNSTVYEINLQTGETINNNITISSKYGSFFNFGSKIGFVFNGGIRVFDPEVGCITKTFSIPGDILNAVTYNPDLGVLYTYTNNKFVELSLE